MIRIQIISIIISILFLTYIARLIIKGKLREEYAFVWTVCTLILIFFSFWREGLEKLAHLLGVYAAPNLVFTGSIFALLIYTVHLSVTVSKLHEQTKTLSQELSFIKQKTETENAKQPA